MVFMKLRMVCAGHVVKDVQDAHLFPGVKAVFHRPQTITMVRAHVQQVCFIIHCLTGSVFVNHVLSTVPDAVMR